MTAFFNNLANLGKKVNTLGPIGDPVDHAAETFVLGKPPAGRSYYGEGPIAPPGAPTQDTAANAAQSQQDALRKRRGVLSTIYGGGSSSGSPAVSSKSTLGT